MTGIELATTRSYYAREVVKIRLALDNFTSKAYRGARPGVSVLEFGRALLMVSLPYCLTDICQRRRQPCPGKGVYVTRL